MTNEYDREEDDGYWCVYCMRYIPADEYGVIIHDNVPHPIDFPANEEDHPQ